MAIIEHEYFYAESDGTVYAMTGEGKLGTLIPGEKELVNFGNSKFRKVIEKELVKNL